MVFFEQPTQTSLQYALYVDYDDERRNSVHLRPEFCTERIRDIFLTWWQIFW